MTGKQERFCEEYVIDHNATRAAKAAGYSEKTAYSQGQRLLKNVEIQKRIAELEARAAEDARLKVENVLRDIQTILSDSLKDGDRKNALKALEMQGKYLSMFTDKIEHSGAAPVKIVDDI